MSGPLIVSVSFEEYSKMNDLGSKLEIIPGVPTYRVAAQFAFKTYCYISEHFEKGWNFWYTKPNATIEAFRITRPPFFRFQASKKWSSISLGEYGKQDTKNMLYALYYLEEAVEMIEHGFRLRRSRRNVMEDVTKTLGLDVYIIKPTLRVVK